MKKILFLIALFCLAYANINAQEQVNAQEKSLIQKVEIKQNSNCNQKSLNINDEGTNNPENSGSTKRIINGRVFYIKETESLKIEFIPN